MNRLFFIFSLNLLLLVFSPEAFAQSRANIRIGGSLYDSWVSDKNNYFAVKASFNYRVLDFIEPGIELGYSKFSSSISSFNPNAVYYLFKVNTYFTDLIFRGNDTHRFETYVALKYGGYYAFITDEYIDVLERENRPDYGLYLGIQYMIFRHIGIYAEGGFGNICNIQFGANLRF